MAAIDAGESAIVPAQVDRWIAAFPERERSRPEVVLLSATAARLRGNRYEGRADLDAALAGFRAAGNLAGLISAAVEAGLVAWLSGDGGALRELQGMAAANTGDDRPEIGALVAMAHAALADLAGEPRTALVWLDGMRTDEANESLLRLVDLARIRMQLLTGDHDAAVLAADEVHRLRPTHETAAVAAMVRWEAGDSAALAAQWRTLRAAPARQHTLDGLQAIPPEVIDASLGLVADGPPGASTRRPERRSVRERTLAALADAASRVAGGHESIAAELIDALLEREGADSPAMLCELARFVVYPWVVSDRARRALTAAGAIAGAKAGPYVGPGVGFAELLLASRLGEVDDWSVLDQRDAVLCSMPLRWSMELAAMAAAAGDRRGMGLAAHLIEVAGHPARGLLDELSSSGGRAATGAARLMLELPIEPDHVTFVSCSGVLKVSGGDPALLRRSKVRELLALLALRRNVTVGEAGDVLWPGAEPDRARDNLRSTLAAARRALELGRPRGAAAFHLRRDGATLRLHPSRWLTVDLWAVQDHLALARQHRTGGRDAAAVAAQRVAVQHWTATFLRDLVGMEPVRAELEVLRVDLVNAALDVASWDLAHGEWSKAADLAARVVADDPYEERAHATAIAAHLEAGSMDEAHLAATACQAALEDLGVVPTEQTALLLRRATAS